MDGRINTYSTQVLAEDVEDLSHLHASRELCAAPEAIHQSVRASHYRPAKSAWGPRRIQEQWQMHTVEPDPRRRNDDKRITHLLVRPQPIVHLPCSEVVTREAVVAEEARESLHVGEDLPIHSQPQGIGVVEGDDANGQADSPRHKVVAGQGDAAVGDQDHGSERRQEKHPRQRHRCGGVRDFQVSCDCRKLRWAEQDHQRLEVGNGGVVRNGVCVATRMSGNGDGDGEGE